MIILTLYIPTNYVSLKKTILVFTRTRILCRYCNIISTSVDQLKVAKYYKEVYSVDKPMTLQCIVTYLRVFFIRIFSSSLYNGTTTIVSLKLCVTIIVNIMVHNNTLAHYLYKTTSKSDSKIVINNMGRPLVGFLYKSQTRTYIIIYFFSISFKLKIKINL